MIWVAELTNYRDAIKVKLSQVLLDKYAKNTGRRLINILIYSPHNWQIRSCDWKNNVIVGHYKQMKREYNKIEQNELDANHDMIYRYQV
jgi:hypothetical protein